jgi:spore maturation protein CgeB
MSRGGAGAIKNRSCDIVIVGLSITSSWGNGHATTYRGLVKALANRGHNVLFLEHDAPWYARNRDMAQPPGARVGLYSDTADLIDRFSAEVRKADVVILGSYTRDGIRIGEWLMNVAAGIAVFYDIDTPVTLAGLEDGSIDYLSRELAGAFDLYLSFTGGPTLEVLRTRYGARMARPLYCSADPELYYPQESPCRWDLGYMGTYSADRAPALRRLMLEPARRWKKGRLVVAGALYPEQMRWPANVCHIEHIAPGEHREFYVSQRFTLNLTRGPMLSAGYSPSVRLFEAGACATPIISDYWDGLEEFFEPGREILVARSPEETLQFIRGMPESHRAAISQRARKRTLAQHTAQHRAMELERYIAEVEN